MNQAIKTKKIEKRTKKIKPVINDKKALNPFLKKKRSDTAKEIVGGGKNPERKDIELGLEKTRKELAFIKITTDEASEFAENIIDTVREPLIALDKDLRVVKVSHSFYEFFKVKPEETVGKLIYDLGSRQWDIPKLRELLETILPQKTTFNNYKVEHEFATIGKRVMLLNARQIQRAFGKGKIILLAIEDITERKHAEEMLRESSANYQMLFNTTLNGMSHCEIVIDADGQPVDYRFLHINDAFETQTGLTKAEVEGRTIREIIPGFEESGFDFIGVHGKVALTGEATQFEQYQEHLQRWYHVQIYSPRHGQFISMFTDITERKRVEQALLESEQRLRRFYESGLLGVIYWNMHGQITGANDKFLEMMGYTRDELERGKIDWINMTPPEYRYLDDNAVKELKATGINKIPFEKEYIRQDGSRVPIILAGAMLDKERFNGVAFVLDITERKRNERLMSLQSEVLKKLISNISPTQTAEEVVAVIKQATGYDAVGLRFRTGTDYPFVASLGYTEEFLKAENTLTNKYPDGGICRNEDGTVSLECTCGMIISGQADPANPPFTPGGSAWTNNSLPFLDVSPDADPRLHPRNRCIHVGFLSLALIPIRSEGGIVGLLHLADRRQDRFTPETISFFEGIGISIGVALAHKRAEAAIKQSNERLSLATNAGGVGIWDLDVINDKLTWDAHMFRLYGITSDDFGGAYKSWKAGVHPEDVARGDAEVQMALRGEKEFDTEFRVVWPSGTIRHIAARAQVHRNALGQPTKLIGTNHDITERKQAEENLVKSKKLLSETEKTGKIGGWEFDAEKLTQSWTEETFRILEIDLTKGEPKVPEGVEFIAPAFRPMAEQAIRRAIEFGEPYDQEWEIITAKGNRKWAHAVAKTYQEQGKTKRVLGYFQDITERKQAEAMLRKNTQLLIDTGEMAQVGGWELDISTNEVSWTEEVCRIHGVEPGYMPKLEEALNFYAPESRPEVEAVLKKAAETGEPYALESLLIPRGSKDKIWVRSLGKAIYNGGKITKLSGTFQNIDKYKRTEEALSENEKKYRALFETMSEGIVYEDSDGKIISANPAAERLLGLSLDQMQGRTSLDPRWKAIHEDGSPFPGETHSLYVAAKTGKSVTNEVMGIYNPQSGTYVWLSVNSTPEFLPGEKKPFRAYAVFRDITERKRAEEKIINSIVEKEVLLKEVHHRVKNNLMIIIGLIKMQEAKADNKMFSTLLLEIEGRVRAMALVHESLHKSADLTQVDLRNYIETMSSQICAQFGAERDIRFSVQGARVDVNLDIAVPCGLILNELITNSYKHAFPENKTRTGAGTCEIAISVKHEGKVLTLSVADNGGGLSADLDLEKSETIGLQLIKMLSRQINGSIELDRSAGTIFRLKFPMVV